MLGCNMNDGFMFKIGNAIYQLSDEIVDEIRECEREQILEFLRSEDWKYELAEDCADAIEELEHYEDDEIH